jgi:hypothetical protein
VNIAVMKEIDEAAAAASPTADEKIDRTSDAELVALILRQQELIVQQTEHLIRAMETMAGSRISLRDEVDELLSAIASITPEDMTRACDVLKSLFDSLKGCGAVGGGAGRSQS